MSVVKQIVNANVLKGIIDLPQSLWSKPVEVIVQPLSETDYLLCNDANKENLTTISLENLESAGNKK